MNRANFETLLSDLYDRYSPGDKDKIPVLLDKYVLGQEFNAVYHMLLRYNWPNNSKYEKNFESPDNVKRLISKYNNGEYILRNITEPKISQEQVIEQKIDEVNKTIKISSEQLENEIQQKLKNFNEYLEDKKQEIENLINIINQNNNSSNKESENVEIKLNLLWTEKEIILPKDIESLVPGTRFIVYDGEGNLLGLEIKNIFCDFITYPNKYIKEITIDKVG